MWRITIGAFPHPHITLFMWRYIAYLGHVNTSTDKTVTRVFASECRLSLEEGARQIHPKVKRKQCFDKY